MCLAILLAWARRWGVHIAIAACLAGIGAPGLAAWTVWPLFWSLAQPVWTIPVLMLYTALVTLVLWALRAVLWPREWAEVERSLPIPRAQVIVSDLEMIAVALLPIVLVLATGAAILLSQDAAALRFDTFSVISALLAVLSGSAATALVALQRLRRIGARAGPPPTVDSPADRRTGSQPVRCGWFRALIWTPLTRSTTRRTVHAAATGFAALCAIAAATAIAGDHASWGLAAFTAGALVTVSRVNALSREEIGAVLSQCAQLPLACERLERVRQTLAMVPASAGLVVLWVATAPIAMRPAVWWAFVAALLASWWIEVRWRPRDPATQAARWLALLSVGMALGTESIA